MKYAAIACMFTAQYLREIIGRGRGRERLISFILLGDFNVNFLNAEHSLFSYVSDVLYSFSLTQVVPSHTHVSPNGNVSLIDLAMLSDIEHLQFCTTVPPLSTSDRLGVSLALKWETHTQRNIPKPRRVAMVV